MLGRLLRARTRRSPGPSCGSGRRSPSPGRRRRPETARERAATPSKVLWSSFSTITRQAPPRPDAGPGDRAAARRRPPSCGLRLAFPPLAPSSARARPRAGRAARPGCSAHASSSSPGAAPVASASMRRNSSRSPRATHPARIRRRSRTDSRWRSDVLEAAGVGQAQGGRAAALDQVDRREPELHVDVGRRRRREGEIARRDAHAGDVAGVGLARVGIEVGHVVGRVARRVLDLEPLDRLTAGERGHVPLGHRRDLAPEAVHVVPVELGRRLQEPRRVDHVLRPALVHVDLRCGNRFTSEPVAPAWSRWMWVSSIARGSGQPSSSAARLDAGPGSMMTPSRS